MSGGYYSHAVSHGLGLDLDSLLQHARSVQKKQERHEIAMAPLFNETFALQTAAMQAQQQVALQQTQLEQQGGQSTQLMTYVPWALGGLGVLGALVLVIRATTKKGRKK